jgi:hypothetical protein
MSRLGFVGAGIAPMLPSLAMLPPAAPTPPHVHILTHCRNPELLYQTLLVFDTLRVGFPTARVTVVDNASRVDVRPAIREAAAKAGCDFHQLEREVAHGDFIEHVVMTAPPGQLVFIDTDRCCARGFEPVAGLISANAAREDSLLV